MNDNTYDLIILGSGCAGLTAAIYAGRAQLRTLLLENAALGGQAATTNEIGNYPGVPDADGPGLMERMLEQAKSFGAEFRTCDVTAVRLNGEQKTVETSAGTFQAPAVILATGAAPRKLGFPGEEEFRGRGVGYCATCDGFFFQDKDIFVVGGGNSAAEEALYLTRFGKKVTVLVRKDAFRCEKSIAEKVLRHPRIEVKFHTELVRVWGDNSLKGAELRDNQTGETFTYTVPEEDGTFGVFVFVGYEPSSALFRDQVELDGDGYIRTNDRMETNLPGVYAAGDVRPKELRQLVTATADGAMAATRAAAYVQRVKGAPPSAGSASHHSGPRSEAHTAPEAKAGPSPLPQETRDSLRPILEKLTRDVVFVLAEDESRQSREMRTLLEQLCAESPRLSLRAYPEGAADCPVSFDRRPAFALCGKDGSYSGVKFSGVPGGHEFNSLIFAIFNFAGPGQTPDPSLRERILAIQKPVKAEIGVTLSCHFCPEVVIAAQRLAMLNPHVEAEMVDAGAFPEFRSRYAIMSVPVLIVNGKPALFGAQSAERIVAALEEG